ncbi:hypothetical protein Bca52824_031546 [Brassica carinata]|uniref:Uncharacterized protein n=1 Tax=Brassica carinata TaxID=52824 RepID=A0A8X7V4A9_BRACI|nr:hypothetical protein Bca52824_031546 [Brassica carinata]
MSYEMMMTRIPTSDSHNTIIRERDLMDLHQQQQRKSFIWDLIKFMRVFMERELDKARAEIKDLKAELNFERNAPKTGRADEQEAGQRKYMQYKRLLKERASEKSEMARMRQELEEERQMHMLEDILREERVQMKLWDARLFLEEKLSKLEESNREGDKERKPKILERECSAPPQLNNKSHQIVRGVKEIIRT